MKFEKNDKYTTIAVYVLITSSVIILFTALCLNFSSIMDKFGLLTEILKPILYAVIISLILMPLEAFCYNKILSFVEKKEKRPRLRKILSLVLTYAIVIAMLVSFISVVIPQVMTSYNDLVEKGPDYIKAALRWLEKQLNSMDFLDPVINFGQNAAEYDSEKIIPIEYLRPELSVRGRLTNPLYKAMKSAESSGISINIAGMLLDLFENSYAMLDKVLPYVWSFLGDFITEIKNLLFGLIISVYFLASRGRLLAQIRKLSSALFSDAFRTRINKICHITYTTFVEFINGKILDALVIGVLCFIAMSVFRMPFAPLISVLVGVTNMIPFVGPFLGAVPGALIIFIVSPMKAVWFVVMIIALQQLDCNLIEPRIVGDKTGLPALFVITSVIVMGGFMGIAGLFLGVPLFAVFYALIREWANNRLKLKGLPVNTDDYIK
ncbi:MAG: AI-2E family transporter [Firmicutes bacterium]|nr:AI-2E family transporter [Bacillota bacterium]